MDRLTVDDIIATTRGWVRENFLYMRPDWPLGEDDPLLRGGVIDSVGVIELVAWLEHTYGITVPETEITEQNFGTLGAVGHFIAACRPPVAVDAAPVQSRSA